MAQAGITARPRRDPTAGETSPTWEALSAALHDTLGNFSDVDPTTLTRTRRGSRDPLEALLDEWEVLAGNSNVAP